MKRIVSLVVLVGIFTLCLLYNDKIIYFVVYNLTDYAQQSTIIQNNQYSAYNTETNFVWIANNFEPHSKQDIINIYYTVINSGMNDFTFYCPREYKDCLKDVDAISDNRALVSHINNFVSVYNSFSDIVTDIDTLGKIDIHIVHNYKIDKINEIEAKIDEILKENITEEMTIENKIKVIHDYIINNTKYDKDRSDKKIIKYDSDTAYGALIEHYAICGGYADSMQLFLDKLNIPNYKISSENHIWNLVYVNDSWYHLDLTWDDPINEKTGEDSLEYDYFLITTEELKLMDNEQHTFDENIYKEAKSN